MAGEDRLAPLARRSRSPLAGEPALEEAEQHARACRRAASCRRRTRAGPASLGGLAGKTLRAPERLVVDSHRLDHRPPGDPLGQLVAPRRQRRVVGDPPGQGRRDRNDRLPCRDDQVSIARATVTPPSPCGDRPHRGADPQALRSQLARPSAAPAAASRRGSGPAARRPGPDQAVEAAARVRVEEDVQERDVAGLGRPDRLRGQFEDGARRRARGALQGCSGGWRAVGTPPREFSRAPCGCSSG